MPIEGLQMSYLKDFQTQISNHNYPAYMRLWEEYCLSDEVDPLELKTILSMSRPVNLQSRLANTSKKSFHYGKCSQKAL